MTVGARYSTVRSLPSDVVPYQRTGEFSQDTVPSGLRKGHATKAGVWARICVLRGRLLYRILEPQPEEQVLTPDRPGVVEPEVIHEVEPLGEVRFFVEFLRREVMAYDVRPGHGVGPLIHGMTRDSVRTALGEPESRGVEDMGDSEPVEIWEYEKAGLQAWFARDDDWRLGTITLFHREAAIGGVRFVGRPESELVHAATEAGLGSVEIEDDFEEAGRDYQSGEECISFWVEAGVVESLTATPRFDDDEDTVLWPDLPVAAARSREIGERDSCGE